jgi:hypothetical protein
MMTKPFDPEKSEKFVRRLKAWCEQVKPMGVSADLLYQAGYALSLPLGEGGDNAIRRAIRASWLQRWHLSDIRAAIEGKILEGK